MGLFDAVFGSKPTQKMSDKELMREIKRPPRQGISARAHQIKEAQRRGLIKSSDDDE